MGKLSNIDQILENLEQSEILKKLILTVKKYWQDSDDQNSLSLLNIKKEANHVIENNAGLQREDIRVVYKDKIIEKKVETIPRWVKGLEQQYLYFQKLNDFPELKSILVQSGGDESVALMSFIGRSSQWQNIIRIWDKLAEHCRITQQEISSEQLNFLENMLFLYNLTLSNAKAELNSPESDDDYDFRKHTQLAGEGTKIKQVLLPALYSGAGEKIKSALVILG
ncbi:hypothetical protein [Acinetobacter variabilis]|uniref:hypothetical protein n=1 Tax=Acinetobacter variabilis TaxID=70346 RepID=UPI0030FA529C